MPEPEHSTAHHSRPRGAEWRRDIIRALAIILSLLALVLTSSVMNWVAPVLAADGEPKRAVIVAGPVHSQTAKYRGYAAAIANAAEAQGMEVKRLFHPKATKSRIKKHANGADLFVYAGHGNGWPSAYGPFQEESKNGLGLNPEDPELATPNKVIYMGADWLRNNIEFAPNAVVILSHLSYASGNASSGMAIPGRSVAVERVDNYANGFLASGAKVVWALGWQPGADVVRALHQEDATMNAIFMTQYRDHSNPLSGWMGLSPGNYPSVRTPGSRVHIDPHPSYGYLRAVSGDLGFTTTEWRDASARPADIDPPRISEVAAAQARSTLATGGSSFPVFTPNGDGVSDSISISYRLSEDAFVGVTVMKDGKPIRRTSIWSLQGRGTISWDGRRANRKYVDEGRFKIILSPGDRAGNVGQPAALKVKALNSMRVPSASPALFDNSDRDGIARRTVLSAKLTRPAKLSWTIHDRSGKIVRRSPGGVAHDPGRARFEWDGTNDAGKVVPEGRYTARVRVIRPLGSYGHSTTVRMMSWRLSTSKWTLRRGERAVLHFESAEPLRGKPTVTVNQRGIPKYALDVKRISKYKFRAAFRPKSGSRGGEMAIRISGTDKRDGTQRRVFALNLR